MKPDDCIGIPVEHLQCEVHADGGAVVLKQNLNVSITARLNLLKIHLPNSDSLHGHWPLSKPVKVYLREELMHVSLDDGSFAGTELSDDEDLV